MRRAFRRHDLRMVGKCRAVKRVAPLVMLEGRRELTGILERLAEGELDLDAVLALRRPGRELRAHRLEIGGLEAEGLEIREARVGVTAGGPCGQRAPEHLYCLGVPPQLAQQVS